ncbi:MAG: class I SAM-dependent methyltransferase [Proteobacteria bacterium]|nr:class I SAM-dependent methyltransferase [Pseudomonadota bacterium]
MAGFIGAEHQFHDPEFVRDWALRFAPTPPRLELFGLILAKLAEPGLPVPHIVELGIGPGYMARHILERTEAFSYEGVDFSDAMFGIARKTIGDLMGRVTLTSADLLDPGWTERLSTQPGAIISTWALHDLGSEQAIANVYAACHGALPDGGVLINGDFIKPDGTAFEYEPGRISVGRHLELLKAAGFEHPECLALLETNIEEPTPANNYACLFATR